MIPIQSDRGCNCSSGPKLTFPCSGAADVGEVADRASRALTTKGSGRMFCLAGIGDRISAIVKSTESAASILAIDGCVPDCAGRSLEEAGFKRINHLHLTDLGVEKGCTEVDPDSFAQVVDKAKIFLS